MNIVVKSQTFDNCILDTSSKGVYSLGSIWHTNVEVIAMIKGHTPEMTPDKKRSSRSFLMMHRSFLIKLGIGLAFLFFFAVFWCTMTYLSAYYGTGARIGSIPLYRMEVSRAYVRIIQGTPLATRVLHKRSDQTYASGLGSCKLEDGGAFIRGTARIEGVPMRITESNDNDATFGLYVPPHQTPSGDGFCESGFVQIQSDELPKAFKP